MATWNSRGLRGSTLEELINRSNEQYREKGLALIQKVPTPITPGSDRRGIPDRSPWRILNRKVRWIISGQCRGFLWYASMRKSAKKQSFPLPISMMHQVRFMREFEQQEGISVLLIYFSGRNEFESSDISRSVVVLGTGAERWKKKVFFTKN